MKYVFIIFIAMISTTASSQDWADLAKYKQANIDLPDANRVVLMGNSITEGWVSQRPEFFEVNPNIIGRGISGQTTPQMLVRMRPDVIDIGADVVVILAGTNDIAGNTGPMTLDEILGNIKSMADLAGANNIKVVLSSVLPAYDYPWRPGLQPNIKIPALNKMIKAYAAEKNYVYLDYFDAMKDDRDGLPKKYAEDEVHPTLLGYSVMEPLLLNAIDQALGKE